MKTDLATRLAHRVHPDPSPAFVASLAADDELMAIAATDMDAAAQMLIDLAVDMFAAHVAIHGDTAQKEAA